LAVFHFSGIWFAVKEAAFPLVIGLAILGSEWTPNPLVRNLFFNEKILRVGLINQRLQARQSESAFLAHLKKSTFFLSCSFFLSAILNFIVAQRVFIELPQHLNAMEKSELLNQQISQMTWLGFVVIAAPSTILTFAILWYTIQGVRRLTGLSLEEILASVPEPESRPLDQDSGAKP
jgi:hypothetical protein